MQEVNDCFNKVKKDCFKFIFRPIIIVAGEPNSVFFEIFCKSVQNNKFKSPIILIGSKRLLDLQIKSLNKKITINTVRF